MKQLNFSKVKEALKDIKNNASYYVGGSLCIDFKDMPSVVLHLNGRGFQYRTGSGRLPAARFLLTKEMTEMVQSIYLEHKGRTSHYESTVKN